MSRLEPLRGAAAQCAYCVGQRRDRMPGHRSELFELTCQEMQDCQPFTAAVIAFFHQQFDALPAHDKVLHEFAANTHRAWHVHTNTTCHAPR
ncbi:hypothetical protein [Nocardia suismassiliense]|uniref:hypothetical protein n=1 Tax=Nocardia suismassiliense TaxID=2077092 RepID=UPI000D1F280F|nr:hypothetical protein [Nocardia suismassiliense]